MEQRRFRRSLPDIVPVKPDAAVPVTGGQRSFWMLDELLPQNTTSNRINAVALEGALKLETFQSACDAIVQRHDALRMSFERQNGTPVQRANPAGGCEFQFVDLEGETCTANSEAFLRLAVETCFKPFDLADGRVFRVTVVRFSDIEWSVIQAFHHIICDGWSRQIITRELFQVYEAFLAGRPFPLRCPGICFRDYAAWLERIAHDGTLDGQLAYWCKKLGNCRLSPMALPTGRPRPAKPGFRTDRRSVMLDADLVAGLKNLASQSACTPMMVLQAVLNVFLAKLTGETDVRVATLVATRNHAQLEDVVGLFLNTVVLCNDLSGRHTFRDIMRQARDTILEAYENLDLPFEKIVEALTRQSGRKQQELLQVLFLYHPATPPAKSIAGLTIRQLDFKDFDSSQVTLTSFDLIFGAREKGPELEISLVYKCDLFDADFIETMLLQFRKLAADVTALPDAVMA